jgi:hypothetical protein
MQRDFTAVVDDLGAILDQLPEKDPRRAFVWTYRRTTLAVADEVRAGRFLDAEWVERWDVAFADLFLAPVRADLSGARVPGPWGVAFAYARKAPQAPPLRHLLLGMNAHINYDLPQALLAVITDDELADPVVSARRAADHEHVDAVLVSRVDAEDAELKSGGGVSLVDRLLGPANRLASKRFLREARRKVWANTRVLSAARRRGGGAYEETLRDLERLSKAKVEDLVRPGPVLLRLGVGGFGVLLPGMTTRG